jgi:N-acetylglucosamine kinase-like BadF-type ATPase
MFSHEKVVVEMASNTGSYLAIDIGGTQLRGFESISGTEFAGKGVTHSSSLALDLAKNIAVAIPESISEIDTLVLSLAAIPQSAEELELMAAAILQRVRFTKLVIASDTKAAALSGDSFADLTIAVGTGITALVKTDNGFNEHLQPLIYPLIQCFFGKRSPLLDHPLPSHRPSRY